MLTVLFAAVATHAAVPSDLDRRVRAYDAAQVKGDRAALERLLADDYLLVNSRGERESKADLIRDYTAPGYRLEPFTVERPVAHVWGDGAAMGGVATLRGVDGGKPFRARLRFTDVWARRKGEWRVIYTMAVREPG